MNNLLNSPKNICAISNNKNWRQYFNGKLILHKRREKGISLQFSANFYDLKLARKLTFLTKWFPANSNDAMFQFNDESLLWIFKESCPVGSVTRFGKTLAFGNYLRVYCEFGNFLNLLWQIFYAIGHTFIILNGQIIKLFSRKRWRLVSAQLSNKFGYWSLHNVSSVL